MFRFVTFNTSPNICLWPSSPVRVAYPTALTTSGTQINYLPRKTFRHRNISPQVISKPSRVTDTLETKVLQITEESGSPKTPSERVANARQECLLRKHQYNRGAISLKRFVGAPSKLRPRFFISNQHKVSEFRRSTTTIQTVSVSSDVIIIYRTWSNYGNTIPVTAWASLRSIQ